MIWSSKYEPLKKEDFLGNKDQIEKCMTWMKNCMKNEIVCPPLMIKGECGSGKSCLARMILHSENYLINQLDYDLFTDRSEMRADLVKYLKTGMIERFLGTPRKKGVIIDDMDCIMDKFLLKELTTLIKEICSDKVKTPIIITCGSKKNRLKDLSKVCITVKLKEPSTHHLFLFGKRIRKAEKINIDDSALRYLVKQSQQDYRKLANLLYYIYLDNSREMSIEGAMGITSNFIERCSHKTIYDITSVILNSYSSLSKMYSLCDQEGTLSGLMLYENYLETIAYNRKKVSFDTVHSIMDIISQGDLMRTFMVMNKIGWELITYCIIFESVIPSYILNHLCKKYSYNKTNTIRFTKVLMNNTQSYATLKILQSVPLFYRLYDSYHVIVAILFYYLFFDEKQKAFQIIRKHKISFDVVYKMVNILRKDLKKNCSRKKKQILQNRYKDYCLLE